MRIYTRGGDKGKTGIHGGERVDKDDIRIEANGTLDELNAEIGIVRTLLPPDHEWQVLLGRIQREMMAVMSHVATPSAIRDKNPNPVPDDLAVFCESHIDDLSAQMEDNGYFILPGGTPVSAHLQLARTITRRAELVITLTLLRIAQHVVCLCRLLKVLLRLLIARVLIRVELYRLLTVRFLYLIRRCILLNAQHFIVIPFSHPCICYLPIFRLFSHYYFSVTYYLVK